ncbi:hypothetical protein G6011_11772 [Alternaria panax]|uniref:Uncharacterized protein n=1 Tax=Alternaria panax TaxID=48097 RepID=A0AAD4F7I5_9PLEO|nr:hypothetical protein G6011_11772 [Alternaria panax]
MLFAATAIAQVTTSFWMPSWALKAEHIGFVASVVKSNETHTTIVADFDNGTDTSALSLGGSPMTMTIGPTVFGLDLSLDGVGATGPDDESYDYFCHWPNPDDANSNRTCAMSYSPYMASLLYCNATTLPSTSESAWILTHTYPARGSESAGTETVKQTVTFGYGSPIPASTEEPALCSGLSSGEQPDEGYAVEMGLPASSIQIYYLVLTAGTDKLEASQAANPTVSSARATGTGDAEETGASSGSAAQPEATEGAAPMVTRVPMLAGLGAAVAALLI